VESGTGSARLRLAAVGAVSGALAGLLFGLCALLIQTAITDQLITKYGDGAVDHGAAFLNPTLVIPMCLLGAFIGILYVAACQTVPLLARAGGLLFAALLTLVLQPLLAAGLDYFSAVVMVSVTGMSPSGLMTKCCAIEDIAPPLLLGLLLSALVFAEGLAVHRLARVGTRWMPWLPGAAYAVVAAGLGLPGFAYICLLLLLATGMLGASDPQR
jgi:hypothetical protein